MGYWYFDPESGQSLYHADEGETSPNQENTTILPVESLPGNEGFPGGESVSPAPSSAPAVPTVPSVPPVSIPDNNVVVIGASPTTNEVYVKNTETGEAYWKPATETQVKQIERSISQQEQMGSKVEKPVYQPPAGENSKRPVAGSIVPDRRISEFENKWAGLVENGFFTGTEDEWADYQKDYESLLSKPFKVITWRGDKVNITPSELDKLTNLSGKEQFDELVRLGIIEKGSQYIDLKDGSWGYVPKVDLDTKAYKEQMHLKEGGATGGDKPPTAKDKLGIKQVPFLAIAAPIALAEPTPIGEIALVLLALAGVGVVASDKGKNFSNLIKQSATIPAKIMQFGNRIKGVSGKKSVTSDDVVLIQPQTGESMTLTRAVAKLSPVQGKVIELPAFPIYQQPTHKQSQEKVEAGQASTERIIKEIAKTTGITQVTVKGSEPDIKVDPEIIRKIGEREPIWREPVVVIGSGGGKLVVPKSMYDAANKSLADRAGVLLAANNVVRQAKRVGTIDIDWNEELRKGQLDKAFADMNSQLALLESQGKVSSDVALAIHKAHQEYLAKKAKYAKQQVLYKEAYEEYLKQIKKQIIPISGDLTNDIASAYAKYQLANATGTDTSQIADFQAVYDSTVKQATQTIAESLTEGKTATQAQTAAQTATQAQVKQAVKSTTATKAITKAAVKQAVMELANTAAMTQALTSTMTIGRLKFPPKKDKKPKEKAIANEYKGSICWKQGFVWYVIKQPYKKENVEILREPPKGAKVLTGAGSAYKTIQRLTGQSPSALFLDLGIFDIKISNPGKAGTRGSIKYKRDIKQKTKGDIILKEIR